MNGFLTDPHEAAGFALLSFVRRRSQFLKAKTFNVGYLLISWSIGESVGYVVAHRLRS